MKLLFTDLDGTLLNDESQISPDTRTFLDEFLAAGNRLVLSSGRPLASILEVKEAAGLTQPGILICSTNGTRIYDCDSSLTIHKYSLPLPWVCELQARAKAFSLHIQTYREGNGADAIISPADSEEVRYYCQRIHLPVVVSENLAAALTEEPCKLLAISLHNHEKLEAFRESIADWAEGKIQVIYSSDKYLELFHKDAGKGGALRFLCGHFQIPLSQAYAAGDAENDISMLQAAGCGIAMKNAPDNVKAHADVVTEQTNDQDGLAHAMRMLLS